MAPWRRLWVGLAVWLHGGDCEMAVWLRGGDCEMAVWLRGGDCEMAVWLRGGNCGMAEWLRSGDCGMAIRVDLITAGTLANPLWPGRLLVCNGGSDRSRAAGRPAVVVALSEAGAIWDWKLECHCIRLRAGWFVVRARCQSLAP